MNLSTMSLDRVACGLATDAGIALHHLADVPRFSNGRRRNEARKVIATGRWWLRPGVG